MTASVRSAAMLLCATLLAAAALPLGAQVAPGAEDPLRGTAADAREAAVRAELEAYYADLSARDWDAFADHFWPGAALVTIWIPSGEEEPRVVFTSVPEFVAQAPEGPGSREIFEERMTDVVIRVTGPLAQAWARYEARFGDPGELIEWRGTDAFTLMEFEGRWRIVSLGYAPDPEEDR